MEQPGKLREGEDFFGPAYEYVPLEKYPESGDIFRAQMARAKTNLAVELTGITAAGTAEPGLFPLVKTGLTIRPVVAAAIAFRDSLGETQRSALSFELESIEWRKWHNMHPNLMRHGTCFQDMSDGQRSAALELLRATFSAAGFEMARNVMKLNEYVAEITGRAHEFGEWYYWMSFFGEPSDTEPWGWQIDGHHLIINCFVLGDQMTLTPQFCGSEPVAATSGQFDGIHVFAEEETRGMDLMLALSPEQRATAKIGNAVPRDVLTAAQVDNLEMPYAGIRYADLKPPQRELFLKIVDIYVGRIRPGHAEVRMDEVEAHLADTYFAWMGEVDDTSPFYYRIHSPVILIEFDHLPGVIYDNTVPTRRHIHTVVRTPNGNDYGHDYLRQHYAQHDHSHPHSPHRLGKDHV